MKTNLLQRVIFQVGRPVDIASIVFARISFGLLILWEVCRYFSHGWIYDYWIEPEFHFGYLGFGWLQPWPGDGMYWHFVGIGILAIFVIFGFAYRLSAALLCLAFSYVFFLEQARYLNHFYLVCLIAFLMVLVPANGLGSLDVKWGFCRRRETIPAWCLYVLRFQMGAVYFFGGIAKLNGDWLAGEPLRTWLRSRADYPLIGAYFEEELVVMSMVYGGLLFDLFIVPLLLWRVTRTAGFVLVVAFNLMNAVLFSIGIFPWFAIAMTSLFFAASWPRRFFVFEANSPTSTDVARPVTGFSWGLPFIAVYIGWQIVMPLRHWAYPGNVSWTEEGHLYAWHMKLRSKSGKIRLWVKDKDTGISSEVKLTEFMESWQARRMTTKPDMIIQFAHFLGEELGRKGVSNVSIHADARVSLNGRRAQRLVDPQVDLLSVSRSIWPKSWVLPLNEPLRPAKASKDGG